MCPAQEGIWLSPSHIFLAAWDAAEPNKSTVDVSSTLGFTLVPWLMFSALLHSAPWAAGTNSNFHLLTAMSYIS